MSTTTNAEVYPCSTAALPYIAIRLDTIEPSLSQQNGRQVLAGVVEPALFPEPALTLKQRNNLSRSHLGPNSLLLRRGGLGLETR
jgi:hypothetical protein